MTLGGLATLSNYIVAELLCTTGIDTPRQAGMPNAHAHIFARTLHTSQPGVDGEQELARPEAHAVGRVRGGRHADHHEAEQVQLLREPHHRRPGEHQREGVEVRRQGSMEKPGCGGVQTPQGCETLEGGGWTPTNHS